MSVEPLAEPRVGDTLQRLRRERGLSLEELGEAAELSPSFLSQVERGLSDISLGRLTRLAHAFGLDTATLLGYYTYGAEPRIMTSDDRVVIDRGPGIHLSALRLPGVNFELITVTFEPGAAMRDSMTHPGIDIVFIPEGEVTLEYEGRDYVLRAGDCGVWPGGHPHTFRNDLATRSQMVNITTDTVWDRRHDAPRARSRSSA